MQARQGEAMGKRIFLGVNVDHVATLRQARGTRYPDPVYAAQVAEQAGADGITMHLREDRRHIQDRDIFQFSEVTQTKLNLEMAITPEMLEIAKRVQPEDCCLVPEKREELTTEGGLDVAGNEAAVAAACEALAANGIRVSLFIDPDERQLDAARRCGAPVVEIHTGNYADAESALERERQLQRVATAVGCAEQLGFIVNAGHGLNYQNVSEVAALAAIHELNIGHGLVAYALWTGLPHAVREMKRLMSAARL